MRSIPVSLLSLRSLGRIMMVLALSALGFAQTAQTFERLNFRTQNAIEFADQYPGRDAFAKINAAIAALPAGGGTVDARGFGATSQAVTTPLIIGSATKPVTLLIDGNTRFEIAITSGADAIQLWSKSSLICLNQTNATSATFALAATARVNTALSSYPRSPAGNLTYQQGCSFEGNSGAHVSSAMVELYNPTDISAVRNELIWNFFGVGLKVSSNQGSGGAGPVNLENLSINGRGNPGAIPVQVLWSKGAGAMGDINFLGGSFTHPGPGGLPIIDLEGSGVEGVNLYGTQFESANRDDIGVLINNARGVLISGPLFTASASQPGADCVKITQSSGIALDVIVNNLINLNAWAHSINDTVNHITDTRSRLVGYTMGSNDPVVESWVGAYKNAGKIADMTTDGLVLSKPESFVEGGAPVPQISQDVCYGDAASHTLRCSYNGGAFLPMAQVIAAKSAAFSLATAAGSCVQNTTAVSGAMPGMAVAASPMASPGTGAVWSGYVSAPGKVTIQECAGAASAGGSAAFSIRVFP